MMKQQPELPISDPNQPTTIKVSSPDFNATLARLRSIHAVIESIAIPSRTRPGEYLFTVRYAQNSQNVPGN
jgi:hypothetical protein